MFAKIVLTEQEQKYMENWRGAIYSMCSGFCDYTVSYHEEKVSDDDYQVIARWMKIICEALMDCIEQQISGGGQIRTDLGWLAANVRGGVARLKDLPAMIEMAEQAGKISDMVFTIMQKIAGESVADPDTPEEALLIKLDLFRAQEEGPEALLEQMHIAMDQTLRYFSYNAENPRTKFNDVPRDE